MQVNVNAFLFFIFCKGAPAGMVNMERFHGGDLSVLYICYLFRQVYFESSVL